jgi:hypothetical protein
MQPGKWPQKGSINFFWQKTCNINPFRTFIDRIENYTETTGHKPTIVLDRSHVPTIMLLMKNDDSYLNNKISWNEFEVVAKKCTHALRSENRSLRNEVRDFINLARHNVNVVALDTDQILDYTYCEDDLAQMESFRVKLRNDRFGFTHVNPSDKDAGEIVRAVFREHNTH